MKHLGILLTILFALLAGLRAQQRSATVRLADGRTVQGLVVSMSLETLKLQVGDEVMTFPALDIRSCQFREPGAEPAADPAAEPAVEPAIDDAGTPVTTASEPPGVEPAAATNGHAAAPVRRATIPDYVVPGSPEAMPADLRHVPLWKRRLQAVDEAYPWLAPAAPTQWFSLGLLLLIGLGLSVHLSVQVVGAEAAQLSRSLMLGGWYLVSGVAQAALVPVHDFSVALMLLGNTALALFALHAMFGLTRWWALVALMVQLGCAVIGFGVLELVDAVLGSLSPAA